MFMNYYRLLVDLILSNIKYLCRFSGIPVEC